MYKVLRLYKRVGCRVLIETLICHFRSRMLARKFGYPRGFFIDIGSLWMVNSSSKIGENVKLGRRCRIETVDLHNGIVYNPKILMGDNVSINDDVHIGCCYSITIGSDVLMASKIYISDHNHGNYSSSSCDSPDTPPSLRKLDGKPIFIGDRVWIGEMVSILPGVSIGSGSIIGSNSVVSRSIPENTIAVGVPARPIKSFNVNTLRWDKVEQ